MPKKEQELLSIYKKLSATEQASVLSFAKFLQNESSDNNEIVELEKPLDISRPQSENVVIAIKRLSATYPMINTSAVLDQAAKLMTEHMLHGKDVKLVIDELELLFSEHYEKYCLTFKDE